MPCQVFSIDSSTRLSKSPGSFQSSPLGHSAGMNSTHLGSDSTPGVPMDSPQFGLDGSSQPSQVQGYPSVDSSVKASVLSAQSQSVPSAKIGQEKVHGQTTIKLERTTAIKSGMLGQTTVKLEGTTEIKSGLPGQTTVKLEGTTDSKLGMPGQISKMVQNLQPQAPERPSWTPPSGDYMNEAILCQVCKTIISDVDNLYVCDHCEKASHFKCMPISTGKFVPRGMWHWEWHCDKCLQLSNGRPLPPKYGLHKLPKVPSTTSGLQSTSNTKLGPLGEKVNHQKVMPDGGSTILTGPTSEVKVENSVDIGYSSFVGKGMDITAASSEEKSSELNPNNTLPLKRLLKSHQDYPDGKKFCNNWTEKLLQDDSGTVSFPAEISTITSGPSEQERPIADSLNSVDWIGRMLKTEDQKAFYHSCCINGLVYRVKDHVLVLFSNRLIPSKLQAMWEDTNNKTKWVTVNLCYFPSDLPVAVGRPYHLESSEVYESIISCIVMAGCIQGPCEVLSPSKFLEEYERRANAGKKPNETFQPLFLCKWIYDESKGLFHDVIC